MESPLCRVAQFPRVAQWRCWGLLCLTLGVWALGTLLGPSQAEAEVRRYAVVIGANQGEPDDAPLLYAVSDAERMADVLGRLGGVLAENMIVLRNPEAASVERVLNQINTRIEADDKAAGNDESLLFVFYSGHADAGAMHLGGTLLDFDRVRALLSRSPAKMRVMVIDACRSGEMTRVKGARPVAPFQIDADGRLDGEGMAIITSSAAHEDALESERLKGSFFTHHFVAGLLGAADVSGDQRVTLTEAYRYAYVETLRATSRAASIQHPTYAFRLSGREDLVLTRLDQPVRGLGRLKLESGGSYVFFEGGEDGALVAEVSAEPGAEMSLAVGRYLVRRRVANKVFEGSVRIAQGQTASLGLDQMSPVPYGAIARKGLAPQDVSAWSLTVGAEVSDSIQPQTGVLLAGVVGASVDLDPLTLRLRMRYGRSSSTNPSLELQQDVLGADLSVLKLFDFWSLTAGFGVRAGGDWARQSFVTDGVAPVRNAFTARGGALLTVGWAPAPWMTLWLEGAADAYMGRFEDSQSGKVSLGAELVPSSMLGVTFYLP